MIETLALLHIGHTARGAAEIALTALGAGLSLAGLILGVLAFLRRGKRPARARVPMRSPRQSRRGT